LTTPLQLSENRSWYKCDSIVLPCLDHLFEVVKKEKGQIDILYASPGVSEY